MRTTDWMNTALNELVAFFQAFDDVPRWRKFIALSVLGPKVVRALNDIGDLPSSPKED